MRYLHFALFCCLILLTSCREDLELVTIDTTLPEPRISFGDGTIAVRGRVITEDGLGIAGARVTNFSETAITDESGRFFVDDFSLLADDSGFFEVSRSGYFTEQRRFTPGPNARFELEIVLSDDQVDGSVNGAAGGTFTHPSGVFLTIPAGAASAGGQTYNDDILISVAYENPTVYDDILQSSANFPGLIGNSERELATYGMAHVKLTTVSGQEVTLSRDQPATLGMPQRQDLASPTDTMGFWQFTESLWVLRGDVSFREGFLRGSIFGSGYYNCDVPYPRAKICARLVDAADLPLSNYPFALLLDNGAFLFTFRTDDRGRFCASVARDQLIQLRIPDPCNPAMTITELTIGPFPAGVTEVGDVGIDVLPARKPIAVVDCDASPVAAQEALIWVSGFGGGLPFLPDPAGRASLLLPDCGTGSVFEVQAVANDQRRTSPLIRVSADDLSTVDLSICSELEDQEEFLTSIPGRGGASLQEVSYLLRRTSNGVVSHQFWGRSTFDNDTTEFFFVLPELALGDYPVAPQVFTYSADQQTTYVCDDCSTAQISVLELGPDNSYVRGTIRFLANRRDLNTGDLLETDRFIIGDFRINR